MERQGRVLAAQNFEFKNCGLAGKSWLAEAVGAGFGELEFSLEFFPWPNLIVEWWVGILLN